MRAPPPGMSARRRPRRLPRAVAPVVAGLLLVSRAAAAQFVFGGSGGPHASAERDTAYTDAVIRLDIEDGPSAVLPALAYNETLLLPLHQFFAMAEIRVAAFALRDSAVAILEPGGIPIRFDPGARLVMRGAGRIPYDSLDVVWWDGDLYVSTGVLDRVLGVSTSVEWADLSATMGQAGSLPVVRRLRRERRRQMLYREQPLLGGLEIPLRQRTVDGAVLSWSLTAASGGQADQQALDLGLGAQLLGGSLELRPRFWGGIGGSGSQLLESWSRVWPGQGWITQVRAGDVQSSGLRARLLQGAVVTNAPFIRSSEFDVEPVFGTVPPGWEVELYDAGRLMAYADANAVGAFRVPLQLRYGQNPFDLVLYGPGGETLRQKHTIRVPDSRLPDGRFEYALAAGRCEYDPCDGLMSADVRYGLSNHVTVQGGWDTFLRGPGRGGALWQPYAVVSAGVLPAVSLTGEAVANGHLRAAAEFEPSPDLRLSAGHTRYAASGSDFNAVPGQSSTSDASLYWRPGWVGGAVFFEGTGAQSSGVGLRQTVERFSATAQVGLVRYSLGILNSVLETGYGRDTAQLTFDASADATVTGPWPWLRGSTVQGQIGVEPARGLAALRAGLGRRLTDLLRLDAAIGWFRGSGYSLELGLSTASRGPRVGTRSRLSSMSGLNDLTYANGSVTLDSRSRSFKLGDVADLGRGGISGVLFRDDNNNGVRDPGEPGLAGIAVSVGGWPSMTDADGRFAAWGLVPSEPVRVDIDTLAFNDPRFVLPAPVVRVRPTPNAFGVIEIPVIIGAEVGGFVVLGDEAVPGVPVVLRELNTGAEITIVTFADGGFYKAGVPPGEYEVTLPDSVADQLKVSAPPLSIFVPPGTGDKRFPDLQLKLEPRP